MELQNIVAAQTANFLESLAVGAVLGGLYDAARVLRLVTRPGRRALFIMDFLYMCAAAFVTFAFFMKATYGQPRLYLLLGEGLGFAAWYFTAGRAVMSAAKAATGAVKTAVRALCRPLRAVLSFFGRGVRKSYEKIKKKFDNMANHTNTLLQKRFRVVYTLLQLNVHKFFTAASRERNGELPRIEDETESAEEFSDPRGADSFRRVSGVFTGELPGGHSKKARDIK